MKRILALVLVLILALSLMTACSKDDNQGGGNDVTTASNDNNPGNTDDVNNSDPTDDPNNNSGDTADRLVADKFSMKTPEGWDVKKKTNEYGEDEATNPDTGSFIQLTFVGWPSSSIKTAEEAVEECFKVYGLGTPVDVNVGGYDAKMNESGSAYMIQDGTYSIAYITISRQSDSDDAAIEAALASFRIN